MFSSIHRHPIPFVQSFIRKSSNWKEYLAQKPYVLPHAKKIIAPPMVYISGEEMTRYCMELILEQWIRPHLDISQWEFYDLSCISRDATDDKVLVDAIAAGKKIGAIFKGIQ